MPVTATNLIQGPATVYFGIFGATEPATISVLPTTGWTDVGGTKDGCSLVIEHEWSELTIDQLLDVVARRKIGRKVGVTTQLAEPTLANLAQVTANAAPVANVLEPDEGVTAFQPTYGAIILDGVAPGGFRRRVTLRKTLPIENVELAYKKDAMSVLAVRWAIHYVSSSIKSFKIEDATS
jgi:hypothetical protein